MTNHSSPLRHEADGSAGTGAAAEDVQGEIDEEGAARGHAVQVGEQLDEEHALAEPVMVGRNRVVGAADTDAIEAECHAAAVEQQIEAADARRGPSRPLAAQERIGGIGAAVGHRHVVMVPVAAKEHHLGALEAAVPLSPSARHAPP